MECKEYSELISAYVDDSLSLEEEEQLLAHLKECQACQQEVRLLKQMKEMLSKLEETELPTHFHDDLMKEINKGKQERMPSFLKWKWQYGGALVAACFAGFLCLGELLKLNTEDKGMGEGIATVEAAPYRIAQETQGNSEQDLAKAKLASKSVQIESEPVEWQIDTEDFTSFVEDLSVYLEEKLIDFEVKTDKVICYKVKEPDELSGWIKDHVKSFKGEIPYEMRDIEIRIMQAG